ncbi:MULTISPECIES: RlmE family RNA methyltransferase [Azospirillum]|uniref:Ribosomal RNA large subunit methyltransferase E n=4 Tax=Azospirillum TaxID=191 RepID=A0A235H795_AZOBR|nr:MULTISPECIES: RlmE family RNA methyltransferase [Azospirillum]KAA1053124.1 23S rRNA (uridine(2552)-2'-O)-methyltransferase [Azospirillum argentinense]MBB3264451.1 23S rRNA (uridine2552-2'-O)-methyltransferase [Azospirillum sp. OGB3]MBY3755217.1 RlmE family RNA methyltransferase [Azospirillum formosense]NUB18128.1 23S rRNA methyltransferase [Azospirillum formosense]OYD81364.1 23S rRNA methyltransferase [Azospirillum brasilense]
MVGKPPSSSTPGGRRATVRVKSAAKRTTSSARWLERHLNDPYVHEATKRGFRSRAAFKLLQLDEKFHLLGPGKRVVDLGAAPGGWTQVAVDKVQTGREGWKVVGLDILPMDPVPGATTMQADFLEEGAAERLKEALGGPADVVLSDMAAPTIGHQSTDHLRIMALAEAAYDFAEEVLAPGGAFVAKLFQGGAEKSLLERLKRDFATVRHAKPPASRAESSETYVVATGFRGANMND